MRQADLEENSGHQCAGSKGAKVFTEEKAHAEEADHTKGGLPFSAELLLAVQARMVKHATTAAMPSRQERGVGGNVFMRNGAREPGRMG